MLSFLIPAYNCEDVIDDAVASVMSQDLEQLDAEVVIVDDASTDSTAEHARAWEARHPDRIRVGFHEHNRGGSAARNTAAALAKGELLYMLDSDNMLTDGCAASQLTLMRETGLDAISVGQLHYFEGSVSNVVEGWVLPNKDGRSTIHELFQTPKVAASHGNYLYTRRLFEAVDGYTEDAGAMDAWTFGLKHLALGFEVGIDKRSYYMHRLNRPNRESYWTREERRGTNDVNAIRALRQEADRLPPNLRELVQALSSHDRFFELVIAGAFRSDLKHFRHIRRRERAKHTAFVTVRRIGLATKAG